MMKRKKSLMSKYELIVKNGRNAKTYNLRNELKQFGFKYSGTKDKWIMLLDSADTEFIHNIEEFCIKNGLKMEMNDNSYNRSYNYRLQFFDNTPPFLNNKYFCIYCGRFLNKEKLTVDHIIPIAKIKKDRCLQEKIVSYGWKDGNDIKNLGASCKSCNSKKGAKMGFWIIKGRIGKSNVFQVARWIFRVITFIAILVVLIKMLSSEYSDLASKFYFYWRL